MKTIHKYLLNTVYGAITSVILPTGSRLLSAEKDTRSDAIALWALVDDEQPHTDEYQFVLAWTGQPLPVIPTGKVTDFIATIVINNRAWHLFEIIDKPEYDSKLVEIGPDDIPPEVREAILRKLGGKSDDDNQEGSDFPFSME
jgi:hypothetical protein